MSGGNGKDDAEGPSTDMIEAPEAERQDLPPTETEETGVVLAEPETAPPAREELEAVRRERDELRDQLLRRRADFENFKRRVERDRHQASQEAVAEVYKSLFPTLDNLERALGSAGDESSVRAGVDLIRRDLQSLLESQGVVADDPKGKRFDPNRHQALSYEPTPGCEEGTVVEVYRKGYALRDRLLRPALVKVASGEAKADDSSEGQPT